MKTDMIGLPARLESLTHIRPAGSQYKLEENMRALMFQQLPKQEQIISFHFCSTPGQMRTRPQIIINTKSIQ